MQDDDLRLYAELRGKYFRLTGKAARCPAGTCLGDRARSELEQTASRLGALGVSSRELLNQHFRVQPGVWFLAQILRAEDQYRASVEASWRQAVECFDKVCDVDVTRRPIQEALRGPVIDSGSILCPVSMLERFRTDWESSIAVDASRYVALDVLDSRIVAVNMSTAGVVAFSTVLWWTLMQVGLGWTAVPVVLLSLVASLLIIYIFVTIVLFVQSVIGSLQRQKIPLILIPASMVAAGVWALERAVIPLLPRLISLAFFCGMVGMGTFILIFVALVVISSAMVKRLEKRWTADHRIIYSLVRCLDSISNELENTGPDSSKLVAIDRFHRETPATGVEQDVTLDRPLYTVGHGGDTTIQGDLADGTDKSTSPVKWLDRVAFEMESRLPGLLEARMAVADAVHLDLADWISDRCMEMAQHVRNRERDFVMSMRPDYAELFHWTKGLLLKAFEGNWDEFERAPVASITKKQRALHVAKPLINLVLPLTVVATMYLNLFFAPNPDLENSIIVTMLLWVFTYVASTVDPGISNRLDTMEKAGDTLQRILPK